MTPTPDTPDTAALVERLTELLARVNLPWRADCGANSHIFDARIMDASEVCVAFSSGETVFADDGEGDAVLQPWPETEIIVAAVNALPDLLATITRLTAEVERLRSITEPMMVRGAVALCDNSGAEWIGETRRMQEYWEDCSRICLTAALERR